MAIAPGILQLWLGSLSQMTLPSGAVVKYSYLQDLPDSGPITAPVNPTDLPGDALIKNVVVHDGITTDTWNYSPGLQLGISTMSGPDGSSLTERSFPHDRALQFTHGGLDGKGGLTYKTIRRVNQTSEEVVIERKWILNSHTGGPAGSTGSSQLVPFNPEVEIEFTTLMDPPGTPAKMSAKKFTYDLNGNVLTQTDYDWFDPSLADPYRDPQQGNVPTQVPPDATVLREVTNTYYNEAIVNDHPKIPFLIT